MTQIEQSTIYAYKLKHLENPNFDKIRSFAKNFVDELPQDLQSELYEKINRGIDQLETEPEMLVYLYSFGNMHQAKLNYAFEHLPDSFFEQSEINIIDYGCGQAIGTMCYVDFLKRKNPNQKIKSVTLIEPSEICLKRAGLHISVFLPDTDIRLVNKTFDQLSDDDLETIQNFCEPMGITAPAEWSKPYDIKDLTKDALESIKEVWIDTLRGKSKEGEAYSHRYVFFQFQDGIVKVLADKVMDKFEDKTCLDPANTLIFKRKFLKNEEKVIQCCAGQPNGKTHLIENDENIPTLHILSNVLDLKFDLPRFSSLISRNIKGYNQFVCVGPYFNYSNKDQRMQEFAESLNGDVSFSKMLDKGELDPLKTWTCQTVVFSLEEEEEILSTEVTEIEIENGVIDKYGVIYSKDGKRLLRAPFEISGDYSIKKGTKVICDRAFFYKPDEISRSLQSVTIPESVTSIGNGAFWKCISLQSIIIPSSVTSIGDRAFRGCESLKSIIILSSVTSIGDDAFRGCASLQSVTISKSVTTIGKGAFAGCISLKSIIIPSSVTSIENEAFWGCISLKSFTIPESVTSIGDRAFEECYYLESVTIPETVTSIGTWAFFGCALKSVTIPKSVTSMGYEAFRGCGSLKSVTISESVRSIGYEAFMECITLESITIPESIESIGNDAFRRCASLKSIYIPKGTRKKFEKMLPEYTDKLKEV